MTVALDARKIDDFGIGTYLEGLLGEFAALGRPARLVAYLPPGRAPDPGLRALTITWEVEPAPPYSARELWRLAWRARRDGAAVYHAPHYVCPPVLPCPAVVTVHDLIHLRFPPTRGRALGPLYARVMLRLAAWRAAALLTVSEATRRDLVARLGVRPERVRVIPNGVAAAFAPAADPEAVAAGLGDLGVVAPYVLFVGNPLPHKNLDRLLRAWAGLPGEAGRLVVAGVAPGRRAAVDAAVVAAGVGGRVHVLPPVPRAALVRLYQGARAVACPSLWEGFGLPALEAMACGTAVVASDRGALPEVVGDAALTVDPTRVDALREALYALTVQESLRAALAARGVARARTFSWRRAAEATLAVYATAGRPGQGRDAGRARP
jgi:alpha-1,3-rhamnosyl/mannosyltransferase